ncbi:MAG: hypothetical protein RLZZ436_2513, partial [Planctomycetota bacterium]
MGAATGFEAAAGFWEAAGAPPVMSGLRTLAGAGADGLRSSGSDPAAAPLTGPVTALLSGLNCEIGEVSGVIGTIPGLDTGLAGTTDRGATGCGEPDGGSGRTGSPAAGVGGVRSARGGRG